MSLKSVLKQRRSEIFQITDRYGIHNIRIFGSVGKELERPDSDVDFLVDLEKGRSLLDLGGLVFDLQQLLGRKVDIVTEKGLHWYIKDAILLAFAGSKFANRLKPLLAMGLRRVAILVVLLQIWVLF